MIFFLCVYIYTLCRSFPIYLPVTGLQVFEKLFDLQLFGAKGTNMTNINSYQRVKKTWWFENFLFIVILVGIL